MTIFAFLWSMPISIGWTIRVRRMNWDSTTIAKAPCCSRNGRITRAGSRMSRVALQSRWKKWAMAARPLSPRHILAKPLAMSDAPFDEIHQFLSDTEWEGAEIAPLAGDASFRRYFRLRKNAQSAMLMHAPPPHEDPAPFLHVAGWLDANGMRAPAVIAEDAPKGWVLIEDFGDHRMREWIDQHPDDERAIYAEAIDTLVRLHRLPAGPFAPYDMAVYLREALLLVEWYCPAMGLEVDGEGYRSAWEAALGPLIERHNPV